MNDNLPNFFIIGVPNAGTTSLWYLLKQHPDVYMSGIKEPRFFSRRDYKNHISWYKSLFKNVNNEKAVGEASVNYCETHLFKDTPGNIHLYNPDAKIIYVIRDPIDRLNSCWRQALFSGHWYKYYYHDELMPLCFEKAIFEYPHFLNTTLYFKNLCEYLKYFDKKKIMIVLYEEFKEDTINVIKSLYNFLEVDPEYVPYGLNKPRNVGFRKKMAHPSLKKITDTIYTANYFFNTKQSPIIKIVSKFYPKVPQIEPQWTAKTKAKLFGYLNDDARNILSYANRPLNIWKL